MTKFPFTRYSCFGFFKTETNGASRTFVDFGPCCVSEICLYPPSFEGHEHVVADHMGASRAAFTLAQMAVGRFVVGLGVGSAAMIIPLYIGELAPAKYRGRMIALENCTVAGGQFIAYCIGARFAQVSHGWRYMVAIGTVPAIVLACFLAMCPESTRQLVAHGKFEQAETVFARLYPASTPEQRRNKVKSIEIDLDAATQAMADKSL